MKKLAVKTVALLLPILIYFGIFIAFEPHNYFGIKNSDRDNDSAIGRIIAFQQERPKNILLGDSRMAHFNLEYVKELTGEEYGTLAFGGASLNESIDLFWFAAKDAEMNNYKLENVVMGVSFYTLNQNYHKDRMAQIETIISNPLAYMLNLDYNLEMLTQVQSFIKGEALGANKEEGNWEWSDYHYADGSVRPYRKNLEEYAEQNIKQVCTGYVLDEKDMAALIEIADYCKEHHISFTVVMPPVDQSIIDLAILPLEIDKQIDYYLPVLEKHMRILNYEYPAIDYDQDMYYDGFHLDPVRGLPAFTKQLFTEDLPNNGGTEYGA